MVNFRKGNNPPFRPNIPVGGIPVGGQSIIGITEEDFFKCPVCGGEIVYIPCGKVIQFDVQSDAEGPEKPVNIKMLDMMVNLGTGQSIPIPPQRILFCLGDCKKPYTMKELAAIVADKKKAAEQKPEQKPEEKKP